MSFLTMNWTILSKHRSNNHTTDTKNNEILIFHAKKKPGKKPRRGSDKYIYYFLFKICVNVKCGAKMT